MNGFHLMVRKRNVHLVRIPKKHRASPAPPPHPGEVHKHLKLTHTYLYQSNLFQDMEKNEFGTHSSLPSLFLCDRINTQQCDGWREWKIQTGETTLWLEAERFPNRKGLREYCPGSRGWLEGSLAGLPPERHVDNARCFREESQSVGWNWNVEALS